MKILCVCNGGNCRSVALAEVLKGVYGEEAISAGTYWIKGESMKALCVWADRIYMVEPFDAKLPEPDLSKWRASPVWYSEFVEKRVILPIGPDVWGHSNWDAIKAAVHAALKEVIG